MGGALERHLRTHDLPCMKCGYNLRGTSGKQCPECGWVVDLGVIRQTLGLSAPGKVVWLLIGIGLSLPGALLGLVGFGTIASFPSGLHGYFILVFGVVLLLLPVAWYLNARRWVERNLVLCSVVLGVGGLPGLVMLAYVVLALMAYVVP